MGQKIVVNSLHLKKNKNWNSFWYVDFNAYLPVFREDLYLYLYLRSFSKLKYNILKRKHLYQIEIVKCFIYRIDKSLVLNLQLMGLKTKQLKKSDFPFFMKQLLIRLKNFFNYKNNRFVIYYKIGKSTALFTALRVATLLEKRVRFQSQMVKKIIKQLNVAGIRISCKGRLNFVDRATKAQLSSGSVPLQTIKANIDYGLIVANTKKGLQSVKVWILNKE
ncbi:ribosomal protein S3 (mitochondrion) [Hemiselmis andersenii]|uniref:Ribosomal protein S3 n=1 Tax=Hemiselmis andersenii TaxID=464988 RepID=B2MWV7_HEMAN|nr:ribosomal protein S3 [Hemiselmis andersenii]ACC78249.1 ribosomal protein S3 [Hemiselmis andersenii]